MLGRHLDHRKEIDLSRRAPWRNCPGSGSGRSEAIFPHALEMDLDCLLDASQCYINGLPRCHAPRQIGHRGSPVTDWVFIDADQILTFSHGFSRLSLACRFTEASVPSTWKLLTVTSSSTMASAITPLVQGHAHARGRPHDY